MRPVGKAQASRAPIAADAAVPSERRTPQRSTRVRDGVDPPVRVPKISGEAFCQAALADIRARVAAGEKVRSVFDIDNTMVDTRPRTLAIARRFDELHGTHYFDGLELEDVDLDGALTAERCGLPKDAAEQFAQFWIEEFFPGAYFDLDLPLASMIELAKEAKAAGAEVIFLTGRIDALHDATVDELRRMGLELSPDQVVCKPDVSVRTSPFKVETLYAWMAEGYHLSWFITEGVRDAAHLQRELPGVPVVLLASPLEREASLLRGDTPVLQPAIETRVGSEAARLAKAGT